MHRHYQRQHGPARAPVARSAHGSAQRAPRPATPANDMPAFLLHLQRTAGNQAVCALLREHGAHASDNHAVSVAPVHVQRTVWVKNAFTGNIEQFAPGPQNFPLQPATAERMQPGDRYDEADGTISGMFGEVRGAAQTLPHGGASSPESGPMEASSHGSEMLSARLAKRRDAFKKGIDAGEKRQVRADTANQIRKDRRADDSAIGRLGGRKEFPTHVFEADGETHRIYVADYAGGPQLMIASIPLPVAAFILEMEARHRKLETKAQDKTRVTKVLSRLTGATGSIAKFNGFKSAADAALLIANAVFVDITKTTKDKLLAEETLGTHLHKLIVAVNALAARFGQHVATPGNAQLGKGKAADHYTKKMAGAMERYRIEGLVGRYGNTPDYPGSGFERDHQPHNDLIETMAALPEFAGKALRNVAAGRTQLGWAIMLHHNRHAAGRTFGNLGGQVTSKFTSDLAAKRPTLATPADVRTWCIDYLAQSLKDDAAAMKAVANTDANYPDITDPAVLARTKQQILDGEDRVLSTESEVRQYGN